MANPFRSLREFFEKLAFAGLKPDAPAGPKKSKIGSLMQSAGDLATLGLKPDEAPLPGPTTLRKRVGIAVALVAIAGVVATLVIVLQQHADKPESEANSGPPPPIVPEGFKVEKNKNLSVEEIEFDKNKEPREIKGTLRNLTDQRFVSCDVSFDVTTKDGAQLGGVSATVENLAPHGTAQFRILVPQKEAAFAMVRELRSN